MKDILEFAIGKEIEAYEFYRDASKKITKDENLAKTFEELASQELKHRKFLEDLLQGDIHSFSMPEIEDYRISETVEKPKLSTDMKFADAVALAMKNEEEAMVMYGRLAKAGSDPQQKDLFEELSKMEELHKVRLEEIYVNAAYGEVW
jgi:rubrerythrin